MHPMGDMFGLLTQWHFWTGGMWASQHPDAAELQNDVKKAELFVSACMRSEPAVAAGGTVGECCRQGTVFRQPPQACGSVGDRSADWIEC